MTTVTVIGSSGTYPSRGRACSSYLVEADGTRVLLDCGSGALSNFTRLHDVADLDAVFLSHMHPDHFVDIYGLFYALWLHPDGPRSVEVYAPRGAGAHIAQLMSDPVTLEQHCRFHEVRAGDSVRVGAFDVTLYAAAHPVETLASRVTGGDRTVAFSGDTGPSEEIVECARDADLFICDSTWLDAEGPHPVDLHMTGAGAGQHAQRAEARRLLVTHVFPTTDPTAVAAEAGEHYEGQVLVAGDLEEHRL